MTRPISLSEMGFTSCQHPRVYYVAAGIKDAYRTGPDGKWQWCPMPINDMYCAMCNAQYDWAYTKQWRGGGVITAIRYEFLPKGYLADWKRAS